MRSMPFSLLLVSGLMCTPSEQAHLQTEAISYEIVLEGWKEEDSLTAVKAAGGGRTSNDGNKLWLEWGGALPRGRDISEMPSNE